MKKIFALILSCLLLLSLAACTEKTPSQTTGEGAAQPTYAETKNPLISLNISWTKNAEEFGSIAVVTNDESSFAMEEQVHVECTGKTARSGDFHATLLHGLTDALKSTDLASLNGKDTLEEGESSGSVYAVYEDGSILSVSFNGSVPEAFVKGYEALEAFILEATAAAE